MLKKSSLSFLSQMALNNNREWFAGHKHLYEEAREDVLQITARLIEVVAKIDPLISVETDPKKSIMRIYRDVRFSKNKDPYKKNFGVWLSAKSKGGNEPGYYFHIQPGASFVAGGYWMPEADHIKMIRQEIDYNISDFLAIVNEKDFAEDFQLNFENGLKKAPKGYNPEDENIKYLKLKSFEVLKKIDDKELFKSDIVDKLKSSFETIYPLVAFLRNALNQ